ncbi:MAG: oligosaccharide flippase family protein [Planctomycetia bacterium]|nr:oligosaccharide flippase family protein [Planctomycetia bacterium]
MIKSCFAHNEADSGAKLRPLSLKKNVAWTFVGNVVAALCQWGVLVVLAKIGPPIIVGQYAMGLAVTGPIMMFASLQLRKFQATDSQREFRFGDYLGLVLISSGLGWLIASCVGWWDSHNDEGLVNVEEMLVVSLVGFSKVCELIAGTFYGLLQQHERLDRITKSNILHSTSSMLALCLGVWLTGNVLWGVLADAVMQLVIIATYDVPSALWILRVQSDTTESSRWRRIVAVLPEIRPRWDWARMRPLMMLGLPMGVVSLLTSLQTNIPRYFVEDQLGKAELGIFCAVAALMMTGITLMRALDQSCMPRLAKLHAARSYREFRWLLLKLAGVYLLLGVAGVWVARWGGRPLLTLLFSAEYAIHTDVLETIMQAAVASYLVGTISSALVTTRCIRPQLPLLCISLVSAFAACYWLVPEYGLWGASMSMVLCKIPYIVIGGTMLLYATREISPHAASAYERKTTAVEPTSSSLRRAA